MLKKISVLSILTLLLACGDKDLEPSSLTATQRNALVAAVISVTPSMLAAPVGDYSETVDCSTGSVELTGDVNDSTVHDDFQIYGVVDACAIEDDDGDLLFTISEYQDRSTLFYEKGPDDNDPIRIRGEMTLTESDGTEGFCSIDIEVAGADVTGTVCGSAI